MLLWIIFYIQLSCTVGALFGSNVNSIIVPCKRHDFDCMVQSANNVVPIIATGVPGLNVGAFDPLEVKEVQAEVSKFAFNLTDNVITGYKNCVVKNIDLNLETGKLILNVTGPSIDMRGHLVMSGELLGVPVEGDDAYNIIADDYQINVDANVEKMKGSDGEMHLVITKFNALGIPLGPIRFIYNIKPNFTKELSPEAVAIFKKNWYLKACQIGSPYMLKEKLNIIFKVVNKFLATIPFDDLFID